ncbi:MAG: Gfo/Idh/MocA family oxidoreductase [Gemmatimonadaceae bacterium]|nr:Gfo/Idh/MocA family oxidoreductase [Chitinophagaceae bacterium]
MKTSIFCLIVCACLGFRSSDLKAQKILRVGVAGLSHDHAHAVMNQYTNGKVVIAGIVEPDTALVSRYKKRYRLHDSLFYPSLAELLSKQKLDAVLAYNAISEHLAVVEACAPKGVSVMVEKPLATTVADATKMAVLARKYKIHLLTNFETTWYASNQQIYSMVHTDKLIGPVRKMVVHDGHEGPKEIGCSKEFLSWLTDPIKNGGGALTDFGCYGANLMTWLMDGKAPLSVMAVTRQIKPDIYPNVDDDATIVLEYPEATGIIEASWNWPYGIKDWEVFGKSGYLHALNGNYLQQRMKKGYEDVPTVAPRYTDNLVYLADVLSGHIQATNDLSSLENNLIVVRILEAAKKSAKEGRKIVF